MNDKKTLTITAPGDREIVMTRTFDAPVPLIGNLHRDLAISPSQADHGHRASGMPVDVRQRLLGNAEDGRFDLARQASDVVGRVDGHGDAAALLEALRVPLLTKSGKR